MNRSRLPEILTRLSRRATFAPPAVHNAVGCSLDHDLCGDRVLPGHESRARGSDDRRRSRRCCCDRDLSCPLKAMGVVRGSGIALVALLARRAQEAAGASPAPWPARASPPAGGDLLARGFLGHVGPRPDDVPCSFPQRRRAKQCDAERSGGHGDGEPFLHSGLNVAPRRRFANSPTRSRKSRSPWPGSPESRARSACRPLSPPERCRSTAGSRPRTLLRSPSRSPVARPPHRRGSRL
jgi:hypothetical protein